MKLEEDGTDEFKIKIKKEDIIPSASPASTSSASDTLTDVQSPVKQEKEDISDCWYQLEDGGEIKDLLPSGIIKNSSKLRFDVKTISLNEDL